MLKKLRKTSDDGSSTAAEATSVISCDASVRPGDVVVLFSTSGSSSNLLSVLDLPVAPELTIVACAGYGGGPMAAHARVGHKLIVDSSSVHRIQEAQGVLIDEICTRITSTTRPEVHA